MNWQQYVIIGIVVLISGILLYIISEISERKQQQNINELIKSIKDAGNVKIIYYKRTI
jgi:uncharacterized membrane protein HdeD (DUF308 family)